MAISLAWIVSLFARFNFAVPPQSYLDAMLAAFPLVLIVQGAIAYRFGLYRGLWRFASLPDLWNIVKASVLGLVIFAMAATSLERVINRPADAARPPDGVT